MISTLEALLERVTALGWNEDYGLLRELEYRIAVHFPPMQSPEQFLRAARDPDMLDAITKNDTYDGIPAWLRNEADAARFVEKNLYGWQWAMWGGAIEIGSTSPRTIARISDGQNAIQHEGPTAPISLMICALSARIGLAHRAQEKAE